MKTHYYLYDARPYPPIGTNITRGIFKFKENIIHLDNNSEYTYFMYLESPKKEKLTGNWVKSQWDVKVIKQLCEEITNIEDYFLELV